MRILYEQGDNKASLWLMPLLENLFFSLVFTIGFFVLDLYYQYHTAHQLHWNHEVKWGLIILFVQGLALSAIVKNRWVVTIVGVMIFFLWIQLIYAAYFGTPVSAIDISLFFSNALETMQDLSQLLSLVLSPFLICLSAFLVILYGISRFKQRVKFRYAWILIFLLFLQPFYNIKIITNHRSIGQDSNVSMGEFPSLNDNIWVSTHKTIIYYLTNTLPHQFFHHHQHFKNILPPLAIRNNHPDVNIIFVMGESLTDVHMSSYGYARPTTPYLDSLKNNPSVIFKKGISGGVTTDISLSLFFNMVDKPDASLQIASTNRNLFKMAKANGFETHFISAQGAFSLSIIKSYLFPAYIDHYGDASFFGTHYKLDALDINLVHYLDSVDFKKPVFLVLHQKGSHVPYALRYTSDFDFFKSEKNASFRDVQLNTYDNSVRYTDDMLSRMVKIIETKTNRPTYFIFTSDHGESLGENGIYGHRNYRINAQHQVPIVFMAFHGADLNFLKQKEQEDINPIYMSHNELAQSVAYLLGYQLPNFSTQKQGYVVTGNSLTGSAGIDQISFDGQGNLTDYIQ